MGKVNIGSLILFVLLLIGSLAAFGIALFILGSAVKGLVELPEYERQLENHCNKVGDNFYRDVMGTRCYGYDNGYKYYWTKDDLSSKFYKVRFNH